MENADQHIADDVLAFQFLIKNLADVTNGQESHHGLC
jgi:hypothetical protein